MAMGSVWNWAKARWLVSKVITGRDLDFWEAGSQQERVHGKSAAWGPAGRCEVTDLTARGSDWKVQSWKRSKSWRQNKQWRQRQQRGREPSWCQEERRREASCAHLQQQLHHVQAVVFHGVDERGAAALDVLRQERSLCLRAPAGQLAARMRSRVRRLTPVRYLQPRPIPWKRSLSDHAPLAPPLLGSLGSRMLTTASMSAPRSSNSLTAS